MSKHIYTERFILEVTPEQLAHINQCAALAKKKRNPFLRRLVDLAYQDAVRCGFIKETQNDQSRQTAA